MNKFGGEQNQQMLLDQINHYNTTWSVNQRIKEWEAFLDGADANTA